MEFRAATVVTTFSAHQVRTRAVLHGGSAAEDLCTGTMIGARLAADGIVGRIVGIIVLKIHGALAVAEPFTTVRLLSIWASRADRKEGFEMTVAFGSLVLLLVAGYAGLKAWWSP